MSRVSLVSDVDVIRERFGIDVVSRLLFTAIRRDAQPLVTPMLLTTPSGDLLVARQQETGNLVSSGAQIEDLLLYEPWVTIDSRVTEGMPVAPTLSEAIAPLLVDDEIELDSGVVLEHYRNLTATARVTVSAPIVRSVIARRLDSSGVLEWFATRRRQARDVAVSLVEGVKSLDGIDAQITTDDDTRFSALIPLASELGIHAFLVSAPPNFSELTGRAVRFGDQVVFLPESGDLVLISDADDTTEPNLPVIGSFASPGEAVRALTNQGRIGVEEQWISAASALALEAEGLELIDSSQALARWRDARDREDLGTQLIAARATVECIEGALALAMRVLDNGDALTEAEIYAEYLRLLQSFRIEHNVPFDIEPYFANLTASERMLFPGPPTDHLIEPSSRCIQFDAGVKVSSDGVVLATSDMARTLPRTATAERAYDILKDLVRETIIRSIVPGAICEDIHATTMSALEGVRTELESLGVMSSRVDFVAEYRKRNVGHLMGKQESFTTELRPGHRQKLSHGAIGAAEIPWRFGEYSLAAEDMWFIGTDRTYITTLRHERGAEQS